MKRGAILLAAVLVLTAACSKASSQPPIARSSDPEPTTTAPETSSAATAAPSSVGAPQATEEPPAEPDATGKVSFVSGRVHGGKDIHLVVGETAQITVSSDMRGYVHVHGYKEPPATPKEVVGTGTDAVITFAPEEDGIYYVEFHGSMGALGVLTTIFVDEV